MQGNLRPTPEVSYPSRFFSLFFPRCPEILHSRHHEPSQDTNLRVPPGCVTWVSHAEKPWLRPLLPLLPAGRESVGPRITCKTVSDDT